jgi:hypothetical protein
MGLEGVEKLDPFFLLDAALTKPEPAIGRRLPGF